MNHQPTQLALLISLIGIGVAPHANAMASVSARLDELAVDAMQALPGVNCTELEAAALPACGGNTDLVWQAPRNPLDRTATAGVRLLYNSLHDDWAPGEVSGERVGEAFGEPERLGHWQPRKAQPQAKVNPAEARDTSRPVNRKQAGSGKTPKVRTLAQAPARVKFKALSRVEASIERVTRIARIDRPDTATPRTEEASSAQVDRLLDSLATLLYEEPAVSILPAAPVAVAPITVAPASVSKGQIVARTRDAEPAQLERASENVETQSSKVLRQLGAIISEERDEVGAVRVAEPQAVVTTQTGKVMAMLGEIAAAQPAVEDGPARRLRKLAARAAKADAKASADATAAVAAEVARAGVDLMLPLELPSVAAVPPAQTAAAPPLMEPAALPLGTLPAAASPSRSSPFGDRQVAVAESSLDRVRGGFDAPGLSISFGIERAVYVNGALVTTTSLNVSDLGRVTAGRGVSSFDVAAIGLIQSGAGNVVSPTTISAGSIGTVIQNTLDGQKIQNVTVINATTNSLGVLRGLNLQSSLRGAVIDSLRR